MHNLSAIIAAGFASKHLDSSLPLDKRQEAEAELRNSLESAYRFGLDRGQMEFASKLADATAAKGSMSTTDLLALASKLQLAEA